MKKQKKNGKKQEMLTIFWKLTKSESDISDKHFRSVSKIIPEKSEKPYKNSGIKILQKTKAGRSINCFSMICRNMCVFVRFSVLFYWLFSILAKCIGILDYVKTPRLSAASSLRRRAYDSSGRGRILGDFCSWVGHLPYTICHQIVFGGIYLWSTIRAS